MSLGQDFNFNIDTRSYLGNNRERVRFWTLVRNRTIRTIFYCTLLKI